MKKENRTKPAKQKNKKAMCEHDGRPAAGGNVE